MRHYIRNLFEHVLWYWNAKSRSPSLHSPHWRTTDLAPPVPAGWPDGRLAPHWGSTSGTWSESFNLLVASGPGVGGVGSALGRRRRREGLQNGSMETAAASKPA